MKRLACLMMVLGVSVCTQAILVTDVVGTYYDATVDNTWPTDAASYSIQGDWLTGASGVYSDLWYLKTGSTTAVNGTAFQGAGPDVPQLTTTVTGIDSSKTYDVYVVFHARNVGGDWFIYAGMPGEALQLYDETNADYILGSGTLISCQTKIGQVSGAGSVSINVDCPLYNNPGDQRTWYDGVALVEVPEPATLLILGLGASIGLLRRK